MPDYTFDHLAEAVDFVVDDPLKTDYARIAEQFRNYSGTSPWILLIGGNARSGKSTLASYLRLGFEKAGHTVLQVSLDNWILAEEMRKRQMNVYDRFQLRILEQDIQKLFAGQRLVIASYAHHSERVSAPVEYDPLHAQIIIIEGIVALSSEKIRKAAHLKLFVTAERGIFLRRIHQYYSWRGKSEEETSLIIKKREVDEYQLIEKESKLADLIINSPFS